MSVTVIINEDLVQIRLRKRDVQGLPKYEERRGNDEGVSESRSYNLNNKCGFSSFVTYENSYIRKTTALYHIQENLQVSNDRLLRVRREQPDHLFSIADASTGYVRSSVRSGDLFFNESIYAEKTLRNWQSHTVLLNGWI